jgi:hypothetical protein
MANVTLERTALVILRIKSCYETLTKIKMLMQSQNTSDSEMTEWRVPVDY